MTCAKSHIMVTLWQHGKVKGKHNCNVMDVKDNIVTLWINVRKLQCLLWK